MNTREEFEKILREIVVHEPGIEILTDAHEHAVFLSPGMPDTPPVWQADLCLAREGRAPLYGCVKVVRDLPPGSTDAQWVRMAEYEVRGLLRMMRRRDAA